MNIELTTTIDSPIDHVWHILADEFTEIHTWFDGVKKSYEIPDLAPTDGAPVGGRICEFTDKAEGFRAYETITGYDKASYRLAIEVVPQNVSAMLPMRKNDVVLTLKSLGANQTEVHLSATPQLKAHGYVMYPMLKLGFGKVFRGLLASLKAHAEVRPTAQAA